jgi:hypothetical protein
MIENALDHLPSWMVVVVGEIDQHRDNLLSVVERGEPMVVVVVVVVVYY